MFEIGGRRDQARARYTLPKNGKVRGFDPLFSENFNESDGYFCHDYIINDEVVDH